MKETHFSIREAFKEGWEGWKKHWALLIAVLAISFFLSTAPDIGVAIFKDFYVIMFLLRILGTLISFYVFLGLIHLSLKITKGESVSLIDFFDIFPYFIRFFMGSLLYNLAIAVGLVFFIVPGIIVSLKFVFFPYFIIEKGLGIIDSFKESNKAVYGSKKKLLLFCLLSSFVSFLGALCFIVGLFIAIPVVSIAHASIYKKLCGQLEELPLITQSE
ncbi:hypothetical protein PHSC3_001202 [Chlamydiales bacterium STE3]|nr:hypothetical protein PHSC3_001202 [Chlamydiales bacterium STE3]